jgi:O-antigen/teichoic acid export membrane protein
MILSSTPIAMQMWESNSVDETKLFLKELTKYYLIITLPAVTGLSLLSKPALKLLTTEDFYEGYKIIPLVATSIFFYGLQRNFQLGLLFYKRTKLIMHIVILSGIINIVLNVMFVPNHGFIAAGYTTLASYLIFAFLIIVVSRRYFTWDFPFKTLARVVVSVTMMSVVILYVLNSEIESFLFKISTSIVAGGSMYFLTLFLMKEFNKRAFNGLLTLFKKV